MLGEVSRHHGSGAVREADAAGTGFFDRVDKARPIGVIAQDKTVVGGLPPASAPDAHPPADHRDAESLWPSKPSDPWAGRGGGWGDDHATVLEFFGAVFVGLEGGREIDAVVFIDSGELGDRAVDADRADGWVEQAEDALGLAERVGEQDRGAPRGGVGAPPVVNVADDVRAVRPAVDGKGEGRLADEGVAGDGLEGLGRRVLLSRGINFVVTGDAPGAAVGAAPLGVLDADLGGPEDVARGVEGDAGAVLGHGRAEPERGGVDGGPDADPEQIAGRGAGEVVVAAGAGVVGVGVCDDRPRDGPPGGDVEVAGRAPEATVGGNDEIGERGARHATLFASRAGRDARRR